MNIKTFTYRGHKITIKYGKNELCDIKIAGEYLNFFQNDTSQWGIENTIYFYIDRAIGNYWNERNDQMTNLEKSLENRIAVQKRKIESHKKHLEYQKEKLSKLNADVQNGRIYAYNSAYDDLLESKMRLEFAEVTLETLEAVKSEENLFE